MSAKRSMLVCSVLRSSAVAAARGRKSVKGESTKGLLTFFSVGRPPRSSPWHSSRDLFGWRLQVVALLVACRSQGCAAPPCTVHSTPCIQGLPAGRNGGTSCSHHPAALFCIFWCADRTCSAVGTPKDATATVPLVGIHQQGPAAWGAARSFHT